MDDLPGANWLDTSMVAPTGGVAKKLFEVDAEDKALLLSNLTAQCILTRCWSVIFLSSSLDTEAGKFTPDVECAISVEGEAGPSSNGRPRAGKGFIGRSGYGSSPGGNSTLR